MSQTQLEKTIQGLFWLSFSYNLVSNQHTMEDVSPLHKSCLPFINEMRQHKGQPFSQNFGHDFMDTTYERDGSNF